MSKENMVECYDCLHKREVHGNAHISCAKPDPEMTGDEHGIKNGWFCYPILFDPTWKTRACNNFAEKTISQSCSKPSA